MAEVHTPPLFYGGIHAHRPKTMYSVRLSRPPHLSRGRYQAIFGSLQTEFLPKPAYGFVPLIVTKNVSVSISTQDFISITRVEDDPDIYKRIGI